LNQGDNVSDESDPLAELIGDDQQLLAWTGKCLNPQIKRLIELKVGKAVADATAPLHIRIRELETELSRTKASVRAAVEAVG
jgi:hypothetical protein